MAERIVTAMACETCKNRNYYFARGKRREAGTKPLTLKKFCRKCRKNTMHKEVKL